MNKYLFFWGHHTLKPGCLSNWWPCKFKVDGVEYNCVEQYMMAQKAKLFKDEEIYNQILKSSNPKEIKALGREVKNFDSNIWDKHKFDIVYTGCYAKFSQNQELKDFMLSCGDVTFVEASPYDKIWGIGMAKCKEAEDPKNWKGQNLLGKALTNVRDNLKTE